MSENKWQQIRLACESHHAILLESILKDKEIPVVLGHDPNEINKYGAYGTADTRRIFYIRQDRYPEARVIIEQFLKDLKEPVGLDIEELSVTATAGMTKEESKASSEFKEYIEWFLPKIAIVVAVVGLIKFMFF